MDFIQIACSKDEARFNLVKPYRDTDKWVATDGHRMHIKEDFPIEKPFSLCGPDVEFPNYSQVIPTKAPAASMSLYIYKDTVKTLKRLVKLAKLATEERQILARIEHGAPEKLELKIGSSSTDTIQTSLTCSFYAFDGWTKPFAPFGINLAYLADALIGIYEEVQAQAHVNSVQIGIAVHQEPIAGGKTSHGPVVITCEKLKAFIMPMRLPGE